MQEDVPDPPPNLVFYHTVEYAPGRKTEGWPIIRPIVEMTLEVMRGMDFRGRRVLDIGCRDGAMSFEAERLGAASVIGIDIDLPVANIAFLRAAFRSQVRFEEHSIYELRPDSYGLFNIIVLPGVIYHLRYPFMALRLVRDLLVDGGTLIVETATLADANRLPLLVCPIGNEGPYDEPTSCTFFNIKGFVDSARTLGFTTIDQRSLMNLPPYDPASTGPLPIDRTVFTCIRNSRLDDQVLMGYWDGDTTTPRLPSWKEWISRPEARRPGDPS